MGGDVVDGDLVGAGQGGDFVGDDDVGREGYFGAARFHHVHDGVRFLDQIGFGQGFADTFAGGEQEGVGDAAADDELVDLVGQRLENGEFRGNLGAAHDGDQRPLGFAQGLGERIDFATHQDAGAGDRGIFRDAVRRRFGAVRGAEGVIDVDVAELGHFLGQFVVVLLFALVDAAVFEQDDFARFHLEAAVDPVLDQADGDVQHLAKTHGDWGQAVFVAQFTLGRTTQVGRDHDGSALFQAVLDRR